VAGLEGGEAIGGARAGQRRPDLGPAGGGPRQVAGLVAEGAGERLDGRLVDVGVVEADQRAQAGDRLGLGLAGVLELDLRLGEQGLDAQLVLDRDLAAALVEADQRLVDLGDAVLEHEDQLAGQLEPPVGAAGVDRGVAGGCVLERLLRGHAAARRVASGGDLAEREDRLHGAQAAAAEDAREAQGEALGIGPRAGLVEALDVGAGRHERGRRQLRQPRRVGLVDPGPGGGGVAGRHAGARAFLRAGQHLIEGEPGLGSGASGGGADEGGRRHEGSQRGHRGRL
jgi:hypothetical protein